MRFACFGESAEFVGTRHVNRFGEVALSEAFQTRVEFGYRQQHAAAQP